MISPVESRAAGLPRDIAGNGPEIASPVPPEAQLPPPLPELAALPHGEKPGVRYPAPAGQPLAQAISPVYYRTKATYVFWMLRDLVGDAALSAALRGYDPAQDAARGLGPNSGSGSFEKLLEQAGLRGNLSWFFADWVDADKGLPDLAIDHVFFTSAETASHAASTSDSSAPLEANGWIVTVDLANSGYAAAEVPITVRNPDTSVTQRIFVPARGKATQRILIQGRPAEVQANDGTVPETQASIHIRDLSASGGSAPASSAQPAPPQ